MTPVLVLLIVFAYAVWDSERTFRHKEKMAALGYVQDARGHWVKEERVADYFTNVSFMLCMKSEEEAKEVVALLDEFELENGPYKDLVDDPD